MRKTLDPPSVGYGLEALLAGRNILLKHSVVQPIIIIIVSLLTRVHKLSVNLIPQLVFLWCKSQALAGQMGTLKL